jgi:hypothetical protein
MYKHFIVLLVIISILLLNFCSGKGGRMMITDDSDRKIEDQMEQILESIKNKDQYALKAMFSKCALDEVENFDESIEYLFKYFEGNIDSKKRNSFSSETSIDYGKKSVKFLYSYTVTTDKDKYLFFVIDFAEDTINPNNTGLYTLRVISDEDKEAQFAYWEDMEIAGICVVKKD